jgi:hypothetical protein
MSSASCVSLVFSFHHALGLKEGDYLDIAISIMTDLHEVAATGGQSGIDRLHPSDMLCKISGCDLICSIRWTVDIRLEEHIIN